MTVRAKIGVCRTNVLCLGSQKVPVRYRNTSKDSDRHSLLSFDNVGTATGIVPSSVANPDPGPGAFLDPGIRMGKKIKIRIGIRIRDEHPGSYFRELTSLGTIF